MWTRPVGLAPVRRTRPPIHRSPPLAHHRGPGRRRERLHGALAKSPFLVTDNGSSFLARAFRRHIDGDYAHVRIGYRTPTQLGLLERFHRTLKSEEVYWKLYASPGEARESLEVFRQRYCQESRCPELELVGPRSAEERGSQVSFRFEHAWPTMRALIDRGVIGDFRAPDVMRFGIAPLYLDAADMIRAAEILAEIVAGRLWDRPRFRERRAVT